MKFFWLMIFPNLCFLLSPYIITLVLLGFPLFLWYRGIKHQHLMRVSYIYIPILYPFLFTLIFIIFLLIIWGFILLCNLTGGDKFIMYIYIHLQYIAATAGNISSDWFGIWRLHLEVCGKTDSQEMTSHKNSHLFHWGRCHTIYVKYVPKLFMEFFSIAVSFIWDTSSSICKKIGACCTENIFKWDSRFNCDRVKRSHRQAWESINIFLFQ